MSKARKNQAFKLLSLFVLAGLFLSSMGLSSLQTAFAQEESTPTLTTSQTTTPTATNTPSVTCKF